ncbi:MAG: asparagine synthetase B family protein [Armatimonadota bacterium]
MDRLTRDAIGEQTVYYRYRGNSVDTASRPDELADIPRRLDERALVEYLCCAFVPGARTMFSGVSELRPGVVWDGIGNAPLDAPLPLDANNFDKPLAWYANRLKDLLTDVITEHLAPLTGQPVGVFLSGGLDSSLVAAFVKQLHQGDVHTISIHFGDGYANELEWSGGVADHLGTKHHVLEITEQMMIERTADVMSMLDDPIGDPLTTPNLLMFEKAASLGISHIFNGEGGDPTFGGPKNVPMVLHQVYGGHQDDLAAMYFRSFQKCFDDLGTLLQPSVHQPDANALAQLLSPYLSDDSAVMQSFLNRLMWMNVRLKGADHILAKVRNIGDATGVRAHSPLFDRRIVQAGFEVPAAFKLDGRREKAVLKDAVKGMLPDGVIERPKSGMMVPVQKWFRGPLKPWAEAKLLAKDACIAPFIRQEAITDWLKYGAMTYPRHGVKIWLILALELWLETHGFERHLWPQPERKHPSWTKALFQR